MGFDIALNCTSAMCQLHGRWMSAPSSLGRIHHSLIKALENSRWFIHKRGGACFARKPNFCRENLQQAERQCRFRVHQMDEIIGGEQAKFRALRGPAVKEYGFAPRPARQAASQGKTARLAPLRPPSIWSA